MLKFLGTGGAFAHDLGNNSAYYKKDDMLVLIDCGEDTTKRIKELNLLDGINTLNIIITHFHSDHVGSLGSLLLSKEGLTMPAVNLISPTLVMLKTLVAINGAENHNQHFYTPENFPLFPIKAYKQVHERMEAYGYIMELEGKTIYYSGDTKSIHSEVLDRFLKGEIDYFYQDLRENVNPFHLSYSEINEMIPENMRSKITCMHFNKAEDIPVIESMGYSTVKRA